MVNVNKVKLSVTGYKYEEERILAFNYFDVQLDDQYAAPLNAVQGINSIKTVR